jgi:RNA polymerase sigma factor (sigma-70 family)
MQDLTSTELLANADWLRRLARSLVLDDTQADDLVQETWMAALRAEQRPRDLRGWLAGVVRHLARNQGRGAARRKGRERAAARGEALPDAHSSLELIERERALLDRVRALTEAQRDVIIARYFEGLAPREIAAHTGVPLATVKTRLARALERLRADLDAQYGGRQEWGLWFAPLAADQRVLSAWVPLTAAALGLSVLAGGTWALLAGPKGSPGLAQQSAAVSEHGVEALDVQEGATDSRRVPVPEPGIDLVFKAGGAPLGNARVLVIAEAALWVDWSLWPDIQRVFEEFGRADQSDGNGLLHIDGSGPWIVRATKGELVGQCQVEMQDTPLVFELQPSPRMPFEVLNERGEPLADVPLEVGWAIPDESPSQFLSPSVYPLSRVSDGDGRSVIHDPLGAVSGCEVEPKVQNSYLDSLRIDLPGLGQGPGEIILKDSYDWSRTAEALELTLAPHGRVEVRVLDGDGEPLGLPGRAFIRTRGAGNWKQGVELVNGLATWPRAGLGRRYQVRIEFPTQGATFETEGAGPRLAGETATWSVSPPTRPAYTARLVDGEGVPHSVGRVMLNLLGERPGMQTTLGPLALDANGQVRVELPEGAQTEHGGVFELWNIEVGWQAIDLPPVASGQVADLGEMRLVLAPLPVLRGRCVDSQDEPVAQLRISAAMGTGGSKVTTTGMDGRFELRGPFDAVTRVKVEDYDARYEPVDPIEALTGEEFVIILQRGHELEGQVLLPAYLDVSRTWLKARAPSGRWIYASLEEDGSFRFGGLSGEPLDLELSLGGTLNAHVVPAVLPGSGPLRIDLRTQWREIKVRVTNLDTARGGHCRVLSDDGIFHIANLPDSVPVPLQGDWKLNIGAKGYRSVEFNAADVGDILELALPEPLRVTIIPSATALAGEFGLLREDTGQPQTLPAFESGRPTTLELPSSGPYRLVRLSSSQGSNGIVIAGRTPTTFVLEVPLDPTGLTLDLDLKAPPRAREH